MYERVFGRLGSDFEEEMVETRYGFTHIGSMK